jgi:hypothetical protein
MGQLRELMQVMESQWEASRKEFNITDTHMKELYKYNEEHRTAMPEGLSAEESAKWDHFNGLNDIPEEEVIRIFGNDHKIIGIEHTVTLDRIKSSVSDFFSWISAVREYRQVHDSYLQLIEFQESNEIDALKIKAEKEEDPIKKATLFKTIDVYYARKYLDFLAEPLDEKDMQHLVAAFSNQTTITYWIERARVKLEQMKISPKFLLEVSQLEKRFLPEKYHQQNNIFLLYFMQLIVYSSDVYDKNNDGRNKAVCIVFGLDKLIRKTWEEEIHNRVLNNLIAFEEQFVGKLPVIDTSDNTPTKTTDEDGSLTILAPKQEEEISDGI